MGIFGNLFGVDNKPLLINAIKEAMNNEQKCIDSFINGLNHNSSEEMNERFNQIKLFEILQEIRNKHSKLIEVKGASSREMYQVLVSLKAINADYNGKTDTATGRIGNFEISLIRTTAYGGTFVQVIASIDGFEVIDNFSKSLKKKSKELEITNKNDSSTLSMNIINNSISIIEENYKQCILELSADMQNGENYQADKYSSKLASLTNRDRYNIKINNITFPEIIQFLKKNSEYERSHPSETWAEGIFFSEGIKRQVSVFFEKSNQDIKNEYIVFSEYNSMFTDCEEIINHFKNNK